MDSFLAFVVGLASGWGPLLIGRLRQNKETPDEQEPSERIDWLGKNLEFTMFNMLGPICFLALLVPLLLIVLEAHPLLYLIAGAGSAIMFTEIAQGRVLHVCSYATLAAASAMMLYTEGSNLWALIVLVPVFLLASGWLLGTGPLGGDTWWTRKRALKGKPAWIGGGDPAWYAAVLTPVAGIGFQDAGLLSKTTGETVFLWSTTERWWSAAMMVATTLTVSSLLALTAGICAKFAVTDESGSKIGVRVGPCVAIAGILVGAIATA